MHENHIGIKNPSDFSSKTGKTQNNKIGGGNKIKGGGLKNLGKGVGKTGGGMIGGGGIGAPGGATPIMDPFGHTHKPKK